MAEPQLSVSWDAYQSNICSGLSQLQQRGEFVDMTLAADGHHVKVHQMIMSLVSPYIKELISSAQCPHPVIFLNASVIVWRKQAPCMVVGVFAESLFVSLAVVADFFPNYGHLEVFKCTLNISHTTLNAILEYIYTGEVLVTKEKLSDVLAAAKALHIKGLKEMDIAKPRQAEETKDPIADLNKHSRKKTLVDKLREYKENKKHNANFKESMQPVCEIFVDVDSSQSIEMLDEDESTEIITANTSATQSKEKKIENNTEIKSLEVYKDGKHNIQYSISNQGGLQIICNRYIYTLKYVQKKFRGKFWRCVDSSYQKCPANIYTNERNEIVKRKFTHNHPFHDSRIVKKVRKGIVYSAYKEAETHAHMKISNKLVASSALDHTTDTVDTLDLESTSYHKSMVESDSE